MEFFFKDVGRDFFVNFFGIMMMDGKDKTIFQTRMTKLFMTSLGGHEREVEPKENGFDGRVGSRLGILEEPLKFFPELVHRQRLPVAILYQTRATKAIKI